MEKKKLGIVIVTYNIADLITKQVECIRRFCKDDDYDIIVVDNSDDTEIATAINYYISSLDVVYLKTQSADHNDSNSHAFACNVSYAKYRNKYKMFFYMDHDLFPVRDFSVAEILKERAMAGLGQAKSKDYYWPGCVMWNNESTDNSLIDFSVNHALGLDTGGNLYKAIESHGKEWCAFFNEKYYENNFYKETFYNFYATINDDMFMHFINSSNWNPVVDNKGRISTLLHILEGRLA
jgi:glycosyltransferase involved in cell wall biosynthesis